jgi:hypothetical protein
MKAERQPTRRKPDSLSVDFDDTVVHRPRKKAATTSTLFRNVIIGLVIVAGGIYALSQRYDLAKLMVIDLSNPSASLVPKNADAGAPAADSAAAPGAAPSHTSGKPAAATHGTNTAPSTSKDMGPSVNVAPVYLGREKEKK